MSAAAGAGIYFEERRGLLTSLWLLLQAQVLGWGRVGSSWWQVGMGCMQYSASLHAACWRSGSPRWVAAPAPPPRNPPPPATHPPPQPHPHLPLCQVMSADSLSPEVYQVICAFNSDLLSQAVGGRTLLVQRLAELVRVRAGRSGWVAGLGC